MTQTFKIKLPGLALALSSSFALAACDEVADMLPGEEPDVTVALIDRSASIATEDVGIYRHSLDAIKENLQGGDRVVIAPVSARSEWRPAIDLTVARSNVRLDQEEAIVAANDQLTAAIPTLLKGKASSGRGANETRLIESIAAASQVFGSPPFESAHLIVLSDGEEDADLVDFGQQAITPELIEDVLVRAEDLGLLPELTGLKVTFAGVAGEDYAGLEAFWQAWAERTGATLTYGRLPYKGRR